jgi:hypothetical protein
MPQGPGLLPNAYRVGASQLGVALYSGISEIALGSVVDTYPRSAVATIQTVAPERTVVRSRHGLALIPRWSFQDAPKLDRVISPGDAIGAEAAAALERWAQERYRLPVERVHEAGGYPYDVAVDDMARRYGRAVANDAIYGLEYPIGHVKVAAPIYPLGLLARPVALGLLGLALAFVARRRRAMRKRQVEATPTIAA